MQWGAWIINVRGNTASMITKSQSCPSSGSCQKEEKISVHVGYHKCAVFARRFPYVSPTLLF
jgi:hypothetical protein